MPDMVTLDMVNIVEHLRQLVQGSPNKSKLSEMINIAQPRLTYFARNPGSIPSPADLTKLLAYYMPGHVFVPATIASPNKAA